MINNVENPISPESKERESRILLHFMRHAEQFKDPAKKDQEFDLSPKGREQAIAKSEKTDLRQAMVFGSPRKRAQQTGGLRMMGAETDIITGTETLEDLKAKIGEYVSYGSKIMSDERLDFTLDKNTPFGAKAFDAFATRKEYLKFLVEDSDVVAKEVGDTEGSTYARQAGAIADIVRKYVSVSPRWSELVNEPKAKYGDTMERFMTSHGGVTESFLAKVIERTKGINERDTFVKLFPNGFDFVQGFDVEILNHNGDTPMIKIKFKHEGKSEEEGFVFEENVPVEIIEEIIKEGKD